MEIGQWRLFLPHIRGVGTRIGEIVGIGKNQNVIIQIGGDIYDVSNWHVFEIVNPDMFDSIEQANELLRVMVAMSQDEVHMQEMLNRFTLGYGEEARFVVSKRW